MSVSRWLYRLVVSVAVCSVSRAAAQPSAYLLNNFDTPAEVNTWTRWSAWGNGTNPPVSITFDPTMNNGGAAGSGSMKVSADFSNPAGNAEFAIARFFSGTFFDESVSLPASAFTDLSMDLRWDPASAPDGFGTFPLIYSGFNTPDGGLVTSTAVATPVSDTGWTHVSFSVPSTPSGQISGFFFYMFDQYPPGDVNYYAGTETFWIDNVQLNYVPEPSVATLFSGGAFAFGLMCTVGRRKRVVNPRPEPQR